MEWSEVELVSTSIGDNDLLDAVLTSSMLVLEISGFSAVEDKEGSLGRVVEGTEETSS